MNVKDCLKLLVGTVVRVRLHCGSTIVTVKGYLTGTVGGENWTVDGSGYICFWTSSICKIEVYRNGYELPATIELEGHDEL